MENLHEKLTELKSKIIKAFESVSVPKGFITDHECEECFGVRKAFCNKDWKAITAEILRENYDKLPLFTAEAFHSFLPSYLIHSLEHFAETDDVYEFTGYQFMVRNDDEVERYSQRLISRFEYFTKEQIEVVLEFIDLAILNEDYYVMRRELERGKAIISAIWAKDLGLKG
ncbi:MAG: hypothetical protein K1X72_22040 [Pyrinomonadaceae bacterium]|nr:hypothetical protein [Pyrinomonadaceae bacterium]